MKGWILTCTFILLNGCSSLQSGPETAKARMESQLSPFVSGEQILDYLSTEAAIAGVSRIKTGVCRPRSSYGCSSWDTRTERGIITLNDNIPGGTGVTNITHEIAHIAAFNEGCFAHGDLWLEYLMGMAERYEERFPGERWGSATPTDSVRAKYQRYSSERTSCSSTADQTPSVHIQCIQEELNKQGFDAGPEDGLNSPSLESALLMFAAGKFRNTQLLPLNVQTAPGLCDVVRDKFLIFGIMVDGEPGVTLEFHLYPDSNISALSAPSAKVSFVTGSPHTILVGERQLDIVKNFCVFASGDYGFSGPSGQVFPGTCNNIGASVGGFVNFTPTLVQG